MHNLHKRVILNPLALQFCISNFSNRPGMFHQAIRVNTPIDFYLAGEVGHRISLNAYAGDTKFLTLNRYCPGATKRVQYTLLMCYSEPFKISADKMRRK